MKSALIGHTGFVGGNLLKQAEFTHLYRSTDIDTIAGEHFDLLVCSGVSAVKWWANKNAEEDLKRVDNLLGHLQTVTADRVFVMSTVDVYPQPVGVDESFNCHAVTNHAYGTNRLHFEDEIKRMFPQAFIARLGGLFGPGLKKNLIFDLLNDNCLDTINVDSVFQFYNLDRLWKDLLQMESQALTLCNFVTEPVAMSDIVSRYFSDKIVGTNPSPRAAYDIRTLYGDAMGGERGYLSDKETVLNEIGDFVRSCGVK